MSKVAVRSLRGAAVVVLVVAASVGAGLPATSSLAANPATFDRIASTAIGENSVYGRVVADGSGTFHAVDREQDVTGQYVTYRRSDDGGRSWTVGARFQGDAGGATRPWIAVDGDSLAIGFIGRWCWSVDACEEVPYLTASTDAGRTWGDPVRLDTQAFDVKVAVDDDRTWVAWQRGSTIELRGTSDGGRTMFASRSYPGSGSLSLAAADFTMVLAFGPAGPGGGGAVTAVGRVVGTLSPFPDRFALPPYWLKSAVATADGRAHVLLIDRPADPDTPASVWVTTDSLGGPFGAPQPVLPDISSSPAIAAVHGTVGVVGTDQLGATWLATSSDRGSSFSAVVPLVGPGDGGEAEIAIATPPVDRPLARFDWSVPARYVDTTGDGVADPANDSGSDAADQLRVFANATMVVSLDGCNSKASAGRTIVDYTWSVGGRLLASGSNPCTATFTVDSGVTSIVRLTVVDDLGTISSTEQDVTPHNHVIVSIGDSVASGEGSPLTGGTSAVTWQDSSCHRSPFAGPALAAKHLEDADPRSSVTFIQLACSGAAIVDSPEVAGIDDPDTGGLLDSYHGVAPTPGSLRPSQMSQMSALVGKRPVDALLVSVGANDAKFSDVVVSCLTSVLTSCDKSSVRTDFETRMKELPDRYRRLAQAILMQGVPAAHVHLTEYFDPTSDDQGVTEMRCAASAVDVGTALLEDDEARWAHVGVIGALNAAGRAAAANAGWHYVDGIAHRFDQHGYCATDHFVVQLHESKINQGDKSGAFHPNRAGQRIYGDAIFAALRDSLLVPAANTSPGSPIRPGALGEIMVLTTNVTSVTSIAVHITGDAPLPGAVRRVDRVAFGDGQFFTVGAPAVDSTAAVGIWTELDGVSAFHLQTFAAQLAVRPNAAVRKVSIVQAAADGTVLVAGRDSLVQATIDAMLAGPEVLGVTTTVIAQDLDGKTRDVVPPTTEQVRFVNGRNVVLLPVASSFVVNAGDTVSAIVEVTDPIGAAVGDDVDNVGTLTLPQGPTAMTTRPLRVLVGRAGLGAQTVSCQSVQGVAERMAAYAKVATPVDAHGISADLFCGLQPPLTQDEPGILAGLALLDEAARYSVADAVVVVVPDGWLQAAAGGAVGVAVEGMRGVIVEAGAPPQTLAHELAHIFGLDHTAGLVPAFGARVDTRLNRAGMDWMAAAIQTKTWTGGRSWDRLAAAIGGPSNAPQAVNPLGTAVWVRGTVERLPDGSWGVTPGEWLPADPGASTDPAANGGLDLTRLSVDQLDAAGNIIGSQPVGLGAANGLYSAGATPPTVPFGFGFSTRVTLLDGATMLHLSLDKTVVKTVLISKAPTVTLTSPAGGTVVGRGDPLTVSWTAATDPTGVSLVADVLISDDDGATWRPLATGVTGSTVTQPVPQDIGGTKVRVRVVVSDGLRSAEAISGAFSAEPTVGSGTPRVAFVRDYLPNGTNNSRGTYSPRLFTMRPDGTDVVALGVPSQYTWTNGTVYVPTYRDPSWGSDGRLWFVSDLQTPQLDGITDPFLQNDSRERIWSSKPDGSDLQRVGSAPGDTSYWGPTAFPNCPTLSPDGNRLAWLGANFSSIYVALRTSTGWAPPTAVLSSGPQPLLTLHPSFPTPSIVPQLLRNPDFPTMGSCPRWAPDSMSLVLAGWELNFNDTPFPRPAWDYSPIVQVAADGTSRKVISPMPTYVQGTGSSSSQFNQTTSFRSADWSDGTLVVSRGDETLALTTSNSLRTTFGAFVMNPLDGTMTRLTPSPDVEWPARPMMLKVAPGGSLHGEVPHPPPTSSPCQLGQTDMAVLDRASGLTDLVPSAVGLCGAGDHSFDWASVPQPGGGSTGLPLVTANPAAAPDDGNAPVIADVTVVTHPSAQPAVGADTFAPLDPPVPAPLSGITVDADRSTVITLSTVDARPASFDVVQPPPASEMTVAGVGGASIVAGTGLDGRLVVTPAPGFRGTTTLSYAVVGHPDRTATATITVIGNVPPLAADDELTVPAAIEAVFEPAVLLANDVDPDAAAARRSSVNASASLRLVSVFGSSNGRAWLDSAGVHVLPAEAGGYTFSYIVADGAGATSEAVVRVTATAPPVDSATTTIPTTTIPITNPRAPDLEQALEVVLPQTGGDISLLRWAIVLVGLGLMTIRITRKRSHRSP